MSETSEAAEMARREVEDLWWLRHSLAALVDGRPDGDHLRVGVLRRILATTEPETTTTEPPARPASPQSPASGEGGGAG